MKKANIIDICALTEIKRKGKGAAKYSRHVMIYWFRKTHKNYGIGGTIVKATIQTKYKNHKLQK